MNLDKLAHKPYCGDLHSRILYVCYMRIIHGAKAKSDRIDSEKTALGGQRTCP